MRNTEQLLKSVGLLAHEIGSLKECNETLRNYGPENFKGDRITVKLRTSQQTAASRNNISLSSFSGQYVHVYNRTCNLVCICYRNHASFPAKSWKLKAMKNIYQKKSARRENPLSQEADMGANYFVWVQLVSYSHGKLAKVIQLMNIMKCQKLARREQFLCKAKL